MNTDNCVYQHRNFQNKLKIANWKICKVYKCKKVY